MKNGKITKMAQIGGTIFHPGIKVSTVIDRAYREYEYQQKPSMTKKRLKKLRHFLARCGADKPTGLRSKS